MISTERLYLNSDRTKVVKEGDPEAAFLLVCRNGVIDDRLAIQYGLLDPPPLMKPASRPVSPPPPPAPKPSPPVPAHKPVPPPVKPAPKPAPLTPPKDA